MRKNLPTEEEVKSLLEKILFDLPKDEGIDLGPISKRLAGRPLSDVSFVVREGARLAARSGNDRLDPESLFTALASTPSRAREGSSRRIGFS